MRLSALYDQGSSQAKEDGFFVSSVSPFAIVCDGVSAPYSPANPPKIFYGMTGGEMVARNITHVFATTGYLNNTLRNLLLEFVNPAIRRSQLKGKPSEMAGATFAAAEIRKSSITIIQAGDCFALWKMRNGQTGITENQAKAHDTEMNNNILQLMVEIAKERDVILETTDEKTRNEIRAEMWNRFYTFLCEARNRDVNNLGSPSGYGLLNGEDLVAELWQTITLDPKELAYLILFSDGIVPWKVLESQTPKQTAEFVCTLYEEGGLPGMLKATRGIERQTCKTSYLNFAEATAVAIEF